MPIGSDTPVLCQPAAAGRPGNRSLPDAGFREHYELAGVRVLDDLGVDLPHDPAQPGPAQPGLATAIGGQPHRDTVAWPPSPATPPQSSASIHVETKMPDSFNGSADVQMAYEALQAAILAAGVPKRESLASLAARHGTDKADNCAHYETYLGGLRDQPVTLLEIGVGGGPEPSSGGASLRTWRDYFPQGRIIGVDIADKSPHAESRVQVFQGSQNDPQFLQAVARQAGELDIVVDDGSHVSAHIILSFETLFPFLKQGGLYIVEDVGTSYWPTSGGSRNLDEPWTTMNYFKRAADGLQWPHSDGAVTPTAITSQLATVHFWRNFIVLRKA